MSKKERDALADAYGKVMAKIETAAQNGGTTSFYASIPSSTGKPGDRCDFFTTGKINLVP